MQRIWTGRIIGLIVGGIFFNIIGAAVGFALGYFLHDKPKNTALDNARQAAEKISGNNDFLIYRTFALLGYVARASGRITENHISKAKSCMQMMGLDANTKTLAVEAFNYGKSGEFDLSKTCIELKNFCNGNQTLISYLLELFIMMALSDGVVEDEERRRLLAIAVSLGVSDVSMNRLIDIRIMEMNFASGNFYGGYSGSNGSYEYGKSSNSEHSGYERQSSQGAADEGRLDAAYKILGVNPEDDFEDIRKAHRKLMLKYHPDRLASQGLPPEMIKLYTEKAKDIQAAFDLIKKARGEK